MRPVVLDTSVVLPAVLSPRGYRRRFLVVLAFGALAARRELLHQEADALHAKSASTSGQLGGGAFDALAEQAHARYARLREALPTGCPDDWRLVASPPLLAEYERKLREAGPRLDPTLREEDVDVVRRQIAATCVEVTDDFDPELIPVYTADRKDDPVIHTALLADATWLIADDTKHISTQPEGITEYRLPGADRRVSAVTFSRFLDHLADVDLDQVDPGLLGVAYRSPSSS
ncbi:MAG TPA: PIN domain-containing protein [Solirubrobacteraceae bacterium]|nr:PIN domain-containing protein [Solirubrobacteraceae bacterium]